MNRPSSSILSGSVDATQYLHDAILDGMRTGKTVSIPKGDYLIKAKGPDAGGVHVRFPRNSKNLTVRCSSQARFFGPDLDNDLIRIEDTSSDPMLSVRWTGGIFDQTEQKNSTVIPFRDKFETHNPGKSATCDGLSIRSRGGLKKIMVDSVKFFAGNHWMTAGGDSGLFMCGAEYQDVRNSIFMGHRDLAFYGSSDARAPHLSRSAAYNNIIQHAFGALNHKRGGSLVFKHNTIYDCVRGIGCEHIPGNNEKVTEGVISDNIIIETSTAIRMTYASRLQIKHNVITCLGARTSDKKYITECGTGVIVLRGVSDTAVYANSVRRNMVRVKENPVEMVPYQGTECSDIRLGGNFIDPD